MKLTPGERHALKQLRAFYPGPEYPSFGLPDGGRAWWAIRYSLVRKGLAAPYRFGGFILTVPPRGGT